MKILLKSIYFIILIYPCFLFGQNIKKDLNGQIRIISQKRVFYDLTEKELTIEAFNDSLSTGRYIMTSKDDENHITHMKLKAKMPNRNELIGKKLPKCYFYDINGKKNDVGIAHINLILFWNISCTACISELNGLNYLISEFPDVKVYALTPDNKEDVVNFIKSHKYNWNNLVIITDYKYEYLDSTQLLGYPSTIITDKELIVKDFFIGKNLRRTVECLNNLSSYIIDGE